MNRPLIVFTLSMVVSCTGTIGAESPPSDPIPPIEAPSCEGVCVAASKMHRLTTVQYRTSIEAMFGPISLDVTLPQQVRVSDLFPVNDPGIRSTDAMLYARAAEAIGDLVAPTIELDCDPQADPEACGVELVERFAPLAFRRPPSDEQRRTYGELFAWSLPDDGLVGAVAFVVATILQAPEFLYIVEAVPEGQPEPLGAYEIATRLSLFLWDGPPDSLLLQAAEDNALQTAEQVEAQALRMLSDERSIAMFRRFHQYWLVDLERFPDVPRALMDEMIEETLFLAESVFLGDGLLETLLTEQDSHIGPELAEFYGVRAGDVLVPGHHGIFTHASVMGSHSASDWKRPIHRGLLVREALLCLTTQAAPPNVADGMNRAEALPENASDRERLSAATEVGSCSACHTTINPPGYAFENFDAAGRFRTEDDFGMPIDASGNVRASDVDGEFTSTSSFLGLVATSQLARDCVAQQWMAYALRRGDEREDIGSLAQAQSQFASSGNLRDLLIAITRSDAFRYRHAPRE